jgi:hypothetical protein
MIAKFRFITFPPNSVVALTKDKTELAAAEEQAVSNG